MQRSDFGMTALVAMLLFAASPGTAQTNITIGSSLGQGNVSYNSFTVTTAGTFDIWTTPSGMVGSTPFDPVLYLFSGYGTGGALLGVDDDGCSPSFLVQCGPAVSFYNSILNNIFLAIGGYTVAVGDFALSEGEARSGDNLLDDVSRFGDYDLRIASLQEFGGGTGVATSTGDVVPEPATMTLLVTGLAGMASAGVRRRRKA